VVVAFALFYFAYLYNFLYVYEFPVDTGGLAFPRAIYQTMAGLYLSEICLIGLFLIAKGSAPQGFIMTGFLILTILFHLKLVGVFRPWIAYVPIDMHDSAGESGAEPELQGPPIQNPVLSPRGPITIWIPTGGDNGTMAKIQEDYDKIKFTTFLGTDD
jgi:Calcium-dependent channel, 7TM region, putative phosphate